MLRMIIHENGNIEHMAFMSHNQTPIPCLNYAFYLLVLVDMWEMSNVVNINLFSESVIVEFCIKENNAELLSLVIFCM